jgi:hypothetical protein
MPRNASRGINVRFAGATALALATVLGACSEGPIDPGAGSQPAINFQRVLFTDAQTGAGRLFSLHNDSTVQTFNFAEPAHRVYSSHSGRFAGVHLRNIHRTHFVDGGVWVDNNRAHRQSAGQLTFQMTDQRPTYENVNGDWMSVFFDGSGIVRWLRESELAAGNYRVAFEVNTGGPHHGGAFTTLVNNTPFFSYSLPNAAGAPTGMAVRNQQGQVVAQVPVGQCPGLHGNASTLNGGVFGCNDGMVVVRPSGSGVVAEKVTLSGDMAGLALRNAYTGTGSTFILGQFAAFPGQPAQRVLATINPATGAIAKLPALPSGVVDHWRAIEPIKGQIVLLGTNGTLYVYNGSTRQLQHTIAGVVPALPASGALTHQVVVAEDLAVVPSPYTGELVLVNLSTGSVTRRINVGGAPSRMALLGASGGGPYSPAP